MKKMKKQFAALAMAAALGASTILSPLAVQAQETDPAPANIQENVQNGGQHESEPEASITQESGQTSNQQEVKKETVQQEQDGAADQTEGEGQTQKSVPNSVQPDGNAPAVTQKAASAFTDSGEAEAAVRASLEGYGVNNETTVEELREFLEKEFVETGKLKAITADISSRTDADTENAGSVTVNIHMTMTPVSGSQLFGLGSGFDINVAIPRLLNAGDIEINETKFPDPEFREYVSDKLDRDKNGSLSPFEISVVTQLNVVKYPAIGNLKGIEYFTALTRLYCYDTGIQDLDVSGNTKLTYLDCKNTGIQTLVVNNNPDLETLDCSNTGIRSLNVSSSPKLIILKCNNTEIEELNVNGNPKLKNLDCANTGIQSLNVSSNIDLAYLDCNNTGIKDLVVSGNPNLGSLDCHSTGIQSLDVSGNPKLITLKCNNTGIGALVVSSNSMLQRLECNNTGIKDLDVSGNPKLETLYCSNTEIQTLNVSGNPNLMTLGCANTGIQTLDVSGNTKLQRLECNNTGIPSLDVSRNTKLTYLDCQATPLAWLNVGSNVRLANLSVPTPNIRLNVTADTFNIKDKFNGIDPRKVTITGNGSINPATGDVSGYDLSKPMTYRYDCGRAKSKVLLDVTVNFIKGISTIDITGNLDMPYSGNPVANPAVDQTGSAGAVTFTYEAWNGTTWELLSGAPTNAGKYRVQAHLAEDEHYYGEQSLKKEFIISKAANGWTEPLSIAGWTYGDQAAAPTAKAQFGSVDFSYSESPDGTYTDKVPADAGTWYVKATVKENDNYSSLESIMDFTILQAANDWTEPLSIAGWTYGDQAAVPTAKAQFGSVDFSYSESPNGIYTDKVPADAGTWYVKAAVKGNDNYSSLESITDFTISQAANAWTEALSIAGWTYGDKAAAPTAKAKSGSVFFTYSNSPNGTYADKVPTNAGTWYVKAAVSGTGNYTALETTIKFTIAKAENEWVEAVDIKGWKENEKPNSPTAKAKFGETFFTYSSDEDGTYTKEVPTKAGTWYVKASVEGTENYTGLEGVMKFAISNKDGQDSPKPDNPKDDPKPVSPKPEKPKDVPKDAPKGSDTRTGGTVQTGDNSRTGLLAVMAMLSAGSILLLAGMKRKKHSEKN